MAEDPKSVFVIDELLPPSIGFGHLPLLWILLPLALVYAACFTWEQYLPGVGMVLLVLGGTGALLFAWKCPRRVFPWASLHIIGTAGLALLLFAGRVQPLVNWSGLPPREATLVLRWEQVFAVRASGKTVSGLARVIEAPSFLPGLHGTLIHCQVRKPIPAVLGERRTVFAATGVLDSV